MSRESYPRRNFLGGLLASACLRPGSSYADAVDSASFFLVGDTHYCANKENPKEMLEKSAAVNGRLLDWLNRLPGTEIPVQAGGGVVPIPRGVLHAGDFIDNGDKGKAMVGMVETELAAFVQDYGLNGGDGRLKWPVYEVHGNHDGPQGDTAAVREIVARNRRRRGLTNVSENGLHYSWDWAGVHFVALGIVVGGAPTVERKRRYAPHGSLPFLKQDLADHVKSPKTPIVLLHHIDVHRYSQEVDAAKAKHQEWDYGDAWATYEVLRGRRVAGMLCGHTHARKLCRWQGTKDDKVPEGIPFLNTDNAAHHHNQAQGILQITVNPKETVVREFATKDAWLTAQWTPQVWRFGF